MDIKTKYFESLKYLDQLKKIYNDNGELVKDKEKYVPVIEVWKSIIDKAAELNEDKNVVYDLISRDFQRFFSSFLQYSNILETMWFNQGNNGEDKKKFIILLKKIVSKDFFFDYFKESSRNFREIRNWANDLKDKVLGRKINSHLNCIVEGLFRQLKLRYKTV